MSIVGEEIGGVEALTDVTDHHGIALGISAMLLLLDDALNRMHADTTTMTALQELFWRRSWMMRTHVCQRDTQTSNHDAEQTHGDDFSDPGSLSA